MRSTRDISNGFIDYNSEIKEIAICSYKTIVENIIVNEVLSKNVYVIVELIYLKAETNHREYSKLLSYCTIGIFDVLPTLN